MSSQIEVLVRQARSADAPELRAMETRCFQSDLWHPEDFLNRDCLVAEFNQAIVGYVVSHEICPPLAGMVAEREILNLAVDAPYRRLGIAGRLLRAELRRGGIHLLEVRESNHAAQALYQKFGFEQIGQRPGYYQSPVEAAIVMRSFPVL